MTTNKQKLFDAMETFRDSYNKLTSAIINYELDAETTVNDLVKFTESYPFDKSFDELAVNEWVDDVIKNDRKDNFTVLNYEYLNTGGNTMVGIHEVWLPETKQTVYACTNEEGCTLTLVDYIRNYFEADDYDEVTLEYVDWGRITGHEKYFELYRRCFNDYTKDDCKYFGITRSVPYYLLSDELQKSLDADYLGWVNSESDGTIETDGVKIITSPDYESSQDDEELRKVKDFLSWHRTIAANEDYYEKTYRLSFANHVVRLPYCAEVWDAVDSLLKRTIEDW